MSLPILVAMVVIGISVAVAAVHLTGGSVRAAFGGPEQALRRFAVDFPDEAVVAVHLTRDARTAFLKLADGRIGIVHGVGDRFLTRLLKPADIGDAGPREPAGVTLRLNDFTWPGGVFEFADAAAAEAVLDLVQGKQPAVERMQA